MLKSSQIKIIITSQIYEEKKKARIVHFDLNQTCDGKRSYIMKVSIIIIILSTSQGPVTNTNEDKK